MNNTISIDDIRFPDMYIPPDSAKQQCPSAEKQCLAVHEQLNGWLKVIRKKRGLTQPVAVFDFDGTCIFNDIGKAVFEFQLDHFLFRHTSDSFAGLFPQCTTTATLGVLPVTMVQERLIHLYGELSSCLTGGPTPQNSSNLQTRKEFKILFLWYVDAARKNPQLGPQHTLTLLTGLLAGYTTQEVGRITIQAMQKAMDVPVAEVTHSIRLPAPFYTITVKMQKGIRVFPEMVELMAGLRKSGIRCSVISASTQWIVEHGLQYLGFSVEREDVYGIRVKLNRQGVLETSLPGGYPVTYRQGKQWVLENLVSGTPVLVAGDAETDYEMLTMPIPIRLIIDHGRTGLIRELIDTPGYLVQAVDRNRGTFQLIKEKRSIPSLIS